MISVEVVIGEHPPEPRIRNNGFLRFGAIAVVGYAGLSCLLCACRAPMGAERVSTRLAYEQVEANALSPGKPSADTVSLLYRYGLDRLAAKDPAEAVRPLHERAVATGERGLLCALAE